MNLPDLILQNGEIYTLDAQKSRAEAVAIRGEWIVAAGSNAEIAALAGPHTQTIDLQGGFAMPGFNDAHVHLAAAGFAKLAVDLRGGASLQELQQRIRARLSEFGPGEWIAGRGWDHTLWPVKQFPTRADLDDISRDHPMFFQRIDGHVAVVNSLALRIAGINRHTADPPGGRILRDSQGEPTGILEEDAAMNLVFLRIPPPSLAQRRRALRQALAEAAHYGVTSVQDYSVAELAENDAYGWDNFRVLAEMRQRDELPVRVTEWLPFTAPLDQLEAWREQGGTSDPWLKTGFLKGFLDGSLGSRTAALLEPYSDEPSTSGILRMDPEATKRLAIERDKAGFQIGFHAIGDRATRVALDVFEAIRKANGVRDRRDRIEHAQVVAPADFARFAALGVIASMQPAHQTTDMRWAEARLGAQRARGAYTWKTMQNDGVHLAFGTDYPVEPIDPMRGIYACVTRELPQGGPAGGWQPQEKISVDDCIRHYTMGSAYAQFEENRKGMIAPHRVADIVVLSGDITRIPAPEILHTTVVMTITGGRVVYRAEK